MITRNINNCGNDKNTYIYFTFINKIFSKKKIFF